MIVNVHERALPVPAAETGKVLDSLAGPRDRLWHSDMVEPMILDRGLTVGSRGGHGPVRYAVVEHVPGRLVRFRFEPGVGLEGDHRFEVLPGPGDDGTATSVLRHTIRARAVGGGRLWWPVLIRPIHDGALEDMLDHVERSFTGRAHRRQPTSRLVRAVARAVRRDEPAPTGTMPDRRRRGRSVVRATVPGGGADGSPAGFRAVDAWATPLLADDSRDPVAWAGAVLGRTVPGVRGLMRLRDAIARPLGLRVLTTEPPPTGFPLLSRGDDRVLLGVDDTHLSFRVQVRIEHAEGARPAGVGAAGARPAGMPDAPGTHGVPPGAAVGPHDPGRVVVTTAIDVHRLLGRAYWAVVRWFHPVVVRRLLATVPRP